MKALLFCTLLFASEITFEKSEMVLGGKKVNVELAKTPKQITRGLMFRTELKNDTGMLFIFNDERVRSFWMKNTFVNLSIGFFDKNKKLVDIQDMKAISSEMEMNIPSYKSRVPAKYALEMNKGWFKRNKIKLGASFKLLSTPNP